VRVTRSLVLGVCFVDRCLSFCTFSFGHCVVCSSIYGFCLPFRYLQTHLLHFISYAYISRAWLSSDEDIVIDRLQNRIKAATGLDIESADDLQVSILVLICDVQIRLSVKSYVIVIYKGNNKITELRTILQRESQNS
jgi:hypothetical protein